MAPISYASTTSSDIDEHASALIGWDQCYSQLNRGAFIGSLAHVSLPGLTLFRETTNVKLRQDVAAPPGTFAFAVPLPGSADGLFGRQSVDTGSVLMLQGGKEEQFHCRQDMDLVAAVLDVRQLGSWGASLAAAANRCSTSVVRGPEATQFAVLIAEIVSELTLALPAVNDKTALLAMPTLIACRCLDLLRSWSADQRPALTAGQRQRLVAEARALIDGGQDEPPGLPDLAQKLGVSMRTLEICFNEVLGLSPSVYIRNLRLNRARRDLRAARPQEVTVAEIAMKWGFWHLGRFASFYRELFGETPSETLRRPA